MLAFLIVAAIVCALFALLYAGICARVIQYYIKNRADEKLFGTLGMLAFFSTGFASFAYFTFRLIGWM